MVSRSAVIYAIMVYNDIWKFPAKLLRSHW